MAGEDVRVTAIGADLTYDAMSGRVVAAQADLTYSKLAARVTAACAVVTHTVDGTDLTDPGVRVMAIHAEVERPIHHKSTFAEPISKVLTFRAPIGKTLTFTAPLDPETLERIVSHPRGGEREPHEEPGE